MTPEQRDYRKGQAKLRRLKAKVKRLGKKNRARKVK